MQVKQRVGKIRGALLQFFSREKILFYISTERCLQFLKNFCVLKPMKNITLIDCHTLAHRAFLQIIFYVFAKIETSVIALSLRVSLVLELSAVYGPQSNGSSHKITVYCPSVCLSVSLSLNSAFFSGMTHWLF